MVTERIEKIRQNYVNNKPAISTERAWLWTESHKQTEGCRCASSVRGRLRLLRQIDGTYF